MFPLENLDLTIDYIYKQLLEKINADGRTKDISTYLLLMPETYKRVFYVYNLIKEYKLIPLIIKVDKCESTSIKFRNQGNILFARSDYYKAWQYYNIALMYSPLHAPSYSLAVANRSAVLAALNHHKECLEDIKMVFTLQYPDSIRDKLLKRKQKCEEALQRPAIKDKESNEEEQQVDNIFFFMADKHEKYIDASSKLEVKSTAEMGRHVVAASDIEVGEILVQEDPFVRLLLRTQVMISCAYCFSRNYNLYPCPYCCMTMYCSRPCVEQAWEEYHSVECPLIASLIKADFTKLEWLALRTTIKARNCHPEWFSVLATVAEAESYTDPEIVGCKMTENYEFVYSSKYYHSIHSLATNAELRDVSDIFQKLVSAAVLMHYLAVADFVEIPNQLLKRNIKIFTAETLMKHMMTAPTNMHGITANIEDQDGNYVDEYNIGSGAYAFLSLINHSCSPNVVRFTRLGTAQINLIAIRPIKRGMQIFDNYGYFEKPRDVKQLIRREIEEIDRGQHRTLLKTTHGTRTPKAHHAVHTVKERQAILKSQYKFSCSCEACFRNWPLYQSLKTLTILPEPVAVLINEHLNQNVIQELQKGDRKRALKIYKHLCELATHLERFIPCKEAAECQESMKQCLAIFSGCLPKGFANSIDMFDHIQVPKVTELHVTSRFFAGCGAFGLSNDI